VTRNLTDPAADTSRCSDPPKVDAREESGPVAAAERSEAEAVREVDGPAGSRSENAASSAGPCLSEDELLDCQAGQCSATGLARVDAHVDECQSCRELVYHLLYDGETPSTAVADTLWPVTFARDSVVNGRYQIKRFVGRGGMGEVYEAFDTLMRSRVALKTVLCTTSDRPHAVRKLMEEVRNALRVGHPNVCRINELQEHQDPERRAAPVPFFTMEFVEGTRLGARLRAGPLPLADVRQIALQLLDGLKAAHARGVLHLDFKSDNVMLRNGSAQPDAVIMDFGLSRALDPEPHQGISERLQLAGTLPYMSLEQLECRPSLGPAADVYSFGVVLYEMLTGELPHRADSLSAMLLKQLAERPPAPSRRLPRLAPALDGFVLRCLETAAPKRFPDADSALRALQSIPEWDQPPASRLQPWHLLAAVSAVAAALILGVPSVRGRADPPAARTAITQAALQPAPSTGTPSAPVPDPSGIREPPAPPGEVAPGAATAPESAAPPASATARHGAQGSSAQSSRVQRTHSGAVPAKSGSPRPEPAAPAADSPPAAPAEPRDDDWGKRGLPTSLLVPKSPVRAAAAPDAGD
jgi:serine/threonine protein kinase